MTKLTIDTNWLNADITCRLIDELMTAYFEISDQADAIEDLRGIASACEGLNGSLTDDLKKIDSWNVHFKAADLNATAQVDLINGSWYPVLCFGDRRVVINHTYTTKENADMAAESLLGNFLDNADLWFKKRLTIIR